MSSRVWWSSLLVVLNACFSPESTPEPGSSSTGTDTDAPGATSVVDDEGTANTPGDGEDSSPGGSSSIGGGTTSGGEADAETAVASDTSNMTSDSESGTPTVQCPECSSGFCDPSGVCARGIFVSSQVFSGNLGGLSGADQYCENLAEAAGLRGDWMAWLSDNDVSAGLRIPGSSDPYVLTDGTRVAANFSVFTTDRNDVDAIYLEHGIDLNEYGEEPTRGSACQSSPAGLPVWTSTLFTGDSLPFDPACGDWLSDATFTEEEGYISLANARAIDSFWTVGYCAEYECGRTASIYCLQTSDD